MLRGNVHGGRGLQPHRFRRLHGQGRRLTGARVGHCMWGAGLRSRRRDGVADRERCRRCPGLRRRAPAGLVELPCVRPAAWPSPLSSPVSRVRAAAWRTWFVVEPSRQFSGSLRERQTAALSRLLEPGPSAAGSQGFGERAAHFPSPIFRFRKARMLRLGARHSSTRSSRGPSIVAVSLGFPVKFRTSSSWKKSAALAKILMAR